MGSIPARDALDLITQLLQVRLQTLCLQGRQLRLRSETCIISPHKKHIPSPSLGRYTQGNRKELGNSFAFSTQATQGRESADRVGGQKRPRDGGRASRRLHGTCILSRHLSRRSSLSAILASLTYHEWWPLGDVIGHFFFDPPNFSRQRQERRRRKEESAPPSPAPRLARKREPAWLRACA